MTGTTHCATWKMPDANHWNGFCTNTFRRVHSPNVISLGDCNICVQPEIASGVATLRAFDINSGAYQWQVLNFITAGASQNGTVWGYKWRESSPDSFATTGRPVNLSYGVATGAGFWNAQEKFQTKTITGTNSSQKWTADLFSVGTGGVETRVLENVGEFAIPDSAARPLDIPAAGFRAVVNYHTLNGISNTGLILSSAHGGSNQQVLIESTDNAYKTTQHKIRMFPYIIGKQPGSPSPPKWVLKAGSTESRFSLYADAAEIKAAFEVFPFVTSVNVTGGPACIAEVVIDLEYNLDTDKIDYFVAECATTTLTSGFISNQWTGSRQIWDMTSGLPVAPFWDNRILPSFASPVFFSEDGRTLITNGNFGTAGANVYAKLEWTIPPNGPPPIWGTVNLARWKSNPFGGMTSTQETRWIDPPFGTPYLGPVPIRRSITSIRNGKIVITSNACRLANSGGGFITTAVIDEGNGLTLETGHSGFQAGCNVSILNDNSYFTTGVEHKYADALSYSPPGTQLDIDGHAYPGGIESHSLTVDSVSDKRESDRPGQISAVGSHAVGIGGVVTYSYETGEKTTTWISQAGSLPNKQEGMWVSHSKLNPSDEQYPWGSYYHDFFSTLSTGYRLSESTQWRFKQGVYLAGSITTYYTTPWFNYYEPVANVQAEFTTKWGTIATVGTPVVWLNPFGTLPDFDDPALPTWQKISLIYMFRARGATVAMSPLIPQGYNCFQFEWKDNSLSLNRSLYGSSLGKGLVKWRRDIGYSTNPLTPDNKIGGNYASVQGNTVVVSTYCDPLRVPTIYSRGPD